MANVHQPHIKKEPSEGIETMPDSTTKERSFSIGEDIFVTNKKDGKLYLGTIIHVDAVQERCLVKFGDNTQVWSKFDHLLRLNKSVSERPVCVVCKKSNTNNTHNECSNDIVRCDQCGRGYHQLCHLPKVPNVNDKFVCRRCVGHEQQQRCKEISAAAAARKQSATRACKKDHRPPPVPVSLPYDPAQLTWDPNHRTNLEQHYCYCGKTGEWYNQMIQCGRCRQWFHEECLRCLQYPLFCGDRFYVFVCALCNDGEEFVRRLELAWVDLVHVALYNLTVIYAKKYYDLDTMIVPYINERWEEWQLPPRLFTATMSERRDQILACLQNDKVRFKCGREIKKRTSIWGLRNRLPPFAPAYALPSSGKVDENILRQMCESNRRLRFLSPSTKVNTRVFQFNSGLPTTPPALNGETGLLSLHTDRVHPTMPKLDKMESSPQVSADDCVGDSLSDSEILQGKAERVRRRKRWRQQQRRGGLRRNNQNLLLDQRSRVRRNNTTNLNSSSLLLALQEEDDKEVTIMMAKKARKLVKNAISKGQKSLKHTSPTNPCESTTTTTTNLQTNGNIPTTSTPAETSGDDETSSRGTLDLFIPPPKDFEGQNNPFHSIQTSTPNSVTPPPVTPTPMIQVPPPPTTTTTTSTSTNTKTYIKTTKRQLSEQDIRIGKNGEVKRRRFRRRNGLTTTNIPANKLYKSYKKDYDVQDNVITLRTVYHRSSKQNNTVVPRSGSTCVEHALNNGRLRSHTNKDKEETVSSITPNNNNSPVKNTCNDVSMEDIKSSLNHYFGAANRIATGENFKVLAKRTLSCGKQQFLLEWDSPAS